LLENKIQAVKDALDKLQNKVITTKLVKDTIDLNAENCNLHI